jgi:D-sedoheptulose 7-phosphate isomerase
MDPITRVHDNFKESIEIKTQSSLLLAPAIARAADLITACLMNEKKILCCGNGSSAAEAQRFSGQMMNRYEMERPGLPAIALTTDTCSITSIADDYQYADVFAKQIRALGQPADILLVFSAGGESHNIIHAIDAGHDREMNIIALTGQEGGQIADLIQAQDVEIRVPSWSAARIHETHTIIVNCICDLVDHQLLGTEG